MPTTTLKRVPVGDIEIASTVVGAGAPVIVIHGAIGLGSTYMRALDPWADDLELVHYDQRGSGDTPVGDPAKVTFAGGLADLDGLRNALGLERVQLVGHSAGAYLAALYAATHPEQTDGVVLLNPGPPLAPALMEQFGAAMAAGRTPGDNEARAAIEASDEFGRGEPLALERHQLNTFIPFFRDRSTADCVSLGFTEITAANIQQGPERMLGSLGALDPMRRLGEIAAPALVVHGELDPLPEQWSRMLAETIPNAEFVRLAGTGHFPMIEEPVVLRETVVPWLLRNAGAQPLA